MIFRDCAEMGDCCLEVVVCDVLPFSNSNVILGAWVANAFPNIEWLGYRYSGAFYQHIRTPRQEVAVNHSPRSSASLGCLVGRAGVVELTMSSRDGKLHNSGKQEKSSWMYLESLMSLMSRVQ